MKLNGDEVGAPRPGDVVAHEAPQGGEALQAEEVPPGWLYQERWAIGREAHCASWYPDEQSALKVLQEAARKEGLTLAANGRSAEWPEKPGSPGSYLWIEPVPADGKVWIG